MDAIVIHDLVSQQVAIVPALIAAGAALAGGVINNIMNRDNIDHKAEVEKDLMKYEYDQFKSPAAQVRGMAAAGLSPSVGLGMGNGEFATPAHGSVSDSPFVFSGVDEIANAVNAIANAKKAGAETVGRNLENRIVEESIKDRIEQVGLQNKWTKEQTAKTTQEFALISGQCNEMQQRIENMRSEKALTDKQVSTFDRRMSAEIDNLKSSADYHQAMAGLTDSQKELFEATMDDMKNIAYWQSQQLEKLVGLLGKYGDAQAVIGMISQVVGSASDIISSITPKGWFNFTGKK